MGKITGNGLLSLICFYRFCWKWKVTIKVIVWNEINANNIANIERGRESEREGSSTTAIFILSMIVHYSSLSFFSALFLTNP